MVSAPPALRVVARYAGPAAGSAPARSASTASALATSCGAWLVYATARSCAAMLRCRLFCAQQPDQFLDPSERVGVAVFRANQPGLPVKELGSREPRTALGPARHGVTRHEATCPRQGRHARADRAFGGTTIGDDLRRLEQHGQGALNHAHGRRQDTQIGSCCGALHTRSVGAVDLLVAQRAHLRASERRRQIDGDDLDVGRGFSPRRPRSMPRSGRSRTPRAASFTYDGADFTQPLSELDRFFPAQGCGHARDFTLANPPKCAGSRHQRRPRWPRKRRPASTSRVGRCSRHPPPRANACGSWRARWRQSPTCVRRSGTRHRPRARRLFQNRARAHARPRQSKSWHPSSVAAPRNAREKPAAAAAGASTSKPESPRCRTPNASA